MPASRSTGRPPWRAALALLVGAALLCGCTRLFFHPEAGLPGAPDAVGLAYRDVWVEAGDGTRLHGWFLPADPVADRPAVGCTLVHFHGNAGNNASFLPAIAWLPAQGVHVLMMDYRGYGLSQGKPELGPLHADAALILDQATARRPLAEEIDPDRVVLFGQSLGGSIALVAAAEAPVRAVAVEGAFSGYRDIARDKLRGFILTRALQGPLSLAIDDAFKPREAIARLSDRPVLIIHDRDDRVVPSHHGERLYAAAGGDKRIWRTDAGHVGAFQQRQWRVAFLNWLDAACAPPGLSPSAS
ncbi:MAG: alpha/beta fold hydrolase [Caulobacterales bacterium]|nr:alpha/beta fold hydrolase [Caulobacterales bacterium]